METDESAVALAAEAVRGQRAGRALHAQLAHGRGGRRVAHRFGSRHTVRQNTTPLLEKRDYLSITSLMP